MASTLKFLIDKQPDLVKRIVYKVIPFKHRYGRVYNDFWSLIKKSKTWSYDETKIYQLNVLRTMLQYCNLSVPYYQKMFQQYGFNPNIKDFDDLKNLPELTKDLIIQNYQDLISLDYKGKKYKMSTSGTTGKRLVVLGSDELFKIECAIIENAYLDHQAKLYQDHSIWIRRYSPNEGDPIFFKDYELNRSYMSAFHLNDKTIFSYVDYFNKEKSKILVSYPSTIYYFALLCRKYSLKVPHLKYIHGASEMCLPQWQELIYDTFGIKLRMHYGQVEKVAFSHQDNQDDNYKENLIYSFTEYDENNIIIGSSFYNKVMPLIRYRTNDKIEKVENPILDGAFPKTIKTIVGRNGDMLITEKDSLVPAVNFYSFMSKYDCVDLFQIIQKRETKDVDFYIVPNYNYTEDLENKLIEEMKNRLGNVHIIIHKKDHLDRDQNSNKFKTVSLI
jgi:phenylacetate-CoA ligase